MCLSCGCGKPNDDHGDPANITAQDLDRAAQAAKLHPLDAARNIHDGAQKLEQEMSIPERLLQE